MPTHLVPPSDDGEGTTPEVYSSLLKHLKKTLVLVLNLLNRFTIVHVAKREDSVPVKEDLLEAMQQVEARKPSNSTVGERLFCSTEDTQLEDILLTLCRTVVESLNIMITVANILEDAADDTC